MENKLFINDYYYQLIKNLALFGKIYINDEKIIVIFPIDIKKF